MDAEILNLLLKFPLSLEREGAKFSAACLAWLPVTCCLLPSRALVAGIKDGGLWWEKGLFPSAAFACLWWKSIKKNNPALLRSEWVNRCINCHGNS